MAERDLKDFKLFPRNLTARADALVRGNPVTTRPESGVENCFPGLEFDQRNLDKVFFPGLLFEMHHGDGIILRDFADPGPAIGFVRREEIQSGVFLAYLRGTFASRQLGVAPAPRILRFTPPAGLESWRMVRDLEPGAIAVVLCNELAFSRVANGRLDLETVGGWLAIPQDRSEEVPGVGRFVILFGERARFLTEDGVIDPRLVRPGDLTQSLCSPWQYDFADCGCFYWASNKPDLVASEHQPDQILNFQRKDRSREGDRTATAEDWILKHDRRWDGENLTIRHADMLRRWEEMSFVIARSETDRYSPSIARPPQRLLSRAEIIDRLKRLAPVEHALAVEYLYAYYSLALPAGRPEGETGIRARIFTAGDEVFQVAIDEMRHLRSVNEILIELGEASVLGRAGIIGEDFDGDGKGFQRPFAILPLTRAQLDWFIDVEAASQNHGGGDEETIDGMYTLILRSIEESDGFSADQKTRLSHLVKVIIDEGIDHFKRFSRARSALAGASERDYLKVTGEPSLLPEGHPDRILQDTVDAAYLVVLRALDYVFRLGDLQRGALMESARRAMFNMDDAARSLAARAHGAMFDHTRFGAIEVPRVAAGAQPMPASAAHELEVARLREIGLPLRNVLDQLRTAAGGEHEELAQRMDGRLADMLRDFEAASGLSA